MSPVIDADRQEWVGLRKAAAILETTPYSLKSCALAGLVRTKMRPPMRALYNRADCEAAAAAFAQS